MEKSNLVNQILEGKPIRQVLEAEADVKAISKSPKELVQFILSSKNDDDISQALYSLLPFIKKLKNVYPDYKAAYKEQHGKDYMREIRRGSISNPAYNMSDLEKLAGQSLKGTDFWQIAYDNDVLVMSDDPDWEIFSIY